MLETDKVFIDTQYFVKAGLHFDGKAFSSFRKYCQNGYLMHVTTSVVMKEVDEKIRCSVKEGIEALQSFRRKAKVLASLPDKEIQALFSEVSEEYIYDKARDAFIDYLDDCATEVADAKSVCGEELLSMYFKSQPPFGAAKKKAEFPDALSLLSLRAYLDKDEKIYVVSGDGDLKGFCDANPQFIFTDSLDRLLDLFTQHDSIRAELIKDYIARNEATLRSEIKSYLESSDVYNHSGWHDSEVDGGIEVIRVGTMDPSIVYIDDGQSLVTFDVDVEFEVTVTGPTSRCSPYDKMRAENYIVGTVSKECILRKAFSVELSIHYDVIEDGLQHAEHEGLTIVGLAQGIEINVDEPTINVQRVPGSPL